MVTANGFSGLHGYGSAAWVRRMTPMALVSNCAPRVRAGRPLAVHHITGHKMEG